MPRPRAGLRVIAGSARGHRLKTPEGLDTRPVTDRVKESVFGHLMPVVPGAAVLDLYAGSGAMAIEALSRGAAAAVLVERNPRAVELIRANLEHTGLADRAEVVRSDVATFLAGPRARPFDLVFCDPPYDMGNDMVEGVLEALTAGWLAPDGLVVIRRHRRSGEPALPEGLGFTRVRAYGDTVVLVAAVIREFDA